MYILKRIFWRLVILLVIGLLYELFDSVNNTESTPTAPVPAPRTPWVATVVAQSRATPTPTEGIRIVYQEPSEGTFIGDMIILKTDVFYRGEPTGDLAYWVVTGDIAREVADTLLSSWNDSFTTDEGYVVNIVSREVSKKLDARYKCTLIEGNTAVSVYAYGEYLSKSVCE